MLCKTCVFGDGRAGKVCWHVAAVSVDTVSVSAVYVDAVSVDAVSIAAAQDAFAVTDIHKM